MAIEKLQLTVAAREKAKAADFNRVTSKIDEIIDNISSSSYYGTCNTIASEQYKSVTIDTFFAVANKPVNGCMVVLNMTYGNTAENMYISINGCYSKPVYYGNAPVGDSVIDPGAKITIVYDGNLDRWYITAGLSAPLPALYVNEYKLKSIVQGRYTDQEIIKGLYDALIGNNNAPVYEGNQILMMWGKSYVPICIMDDEDPYTFEFVYGSKHYAFRLYIKPSNEYVLAVTDKGSNIITQWEE